MINCLFSDYDENTKIINSGSIYLSVYQNKATNEDILVITDKKGNFSKREYKPLFVIIIDISGSMSKYKDYLQHQVIPKLLEKLGYIWQNNEKELP